jgi:hypothetical protein
LKTSIGKLFTFVLALLFCHLNTSAKSSNTTYDIQSFEGKKEKILLRENPSLEPLLIIYKNDTLKLCNNQHGIRDVKLLNPYFLQIAYGMHGGSEVKRRAIVVVCIYNNKLHIPIPVFTTVESFVHNMFYDFHSINLKIEKDPLFKYKLTVKEHIFVRDLDDSSKILCDESITTAVKFDTATNRFYNRRENLNKQYKVLKERTINADIEEMISVKGELPVLKLNNPKCKDCGEGTRYLYFNNNWFEESGNFGNKNNLSSLTY